MPKKVVSLPKEVIILENDDKADWTESWNPHRDLGCLPHPARILALGGVSKGKTNTLINLFLRHQTGKDCPKFQKLIVITCDINSKQFDQLEPNVITDEIFNVDDIDPDEKTCVLIDDYEMEGLKKEDKRKLSTLMRYISSHSNVSVYMSYQSFFDVPNLLRKCANVFVIYKPDSLSELTTIENRMGLSKDTLSYIFSEIANGPYDSIMIDRTINTPAPIRVNIYDIVDPA